jgi:diaminopimelate decarboxylase
MWIAAAGEAARRFGTPCYIFSWPMVLRALAELSAIQNAVPVRHWLSFKSQPLRLLATEWQATGRGIEVVSDFELNAAITMGYPPKSILVNGTGKQRWLPSYGLSGLQVVFDSVEEVKSLASVARKYAWRVGLRFALESQVDADDTTFGTQFGLSESEAEQALNILKLADVVPEIAHFHIMSNISHASLYLDAIN